MYTTLGRKLSGELASLVFSVDVVRCVVGDIVPAIFSLLLTVLYTMLTLTHTVFYCMQLREYQTPIQHSRCKC